MGLITGYLYTTPPLKMTQRGRPRKIENLFKPAKAPKFSDQQGSAGYDNARDNIDPHIKTGAITLKEINGSPIKFYSNGNQIAQINSDRRIGILGNFTNPYANVAIYDNDASVTPQFRIDNAGSGDAAIAWELTGLIGFSMGIDNSDDDKFKISASSGDLGNLNLLTIDGAGRFGVGTTAPVTKFHIVDDILCQGNDGWNGVGDLALLRFGNSATASSGVGARYGTGTIISCWKIGAGGYFGSDALDAITIADSTGNVGIGTTTPAASAKLEISSTTGALLLPRMTTTQMNALTAVNGMMVYDSTLNLGMIYENGGWRNI